MWTRLLWPDDRLLQALCLTLVSNIDVYGMHGQVDSRTNLSLHDKFLQPFARTRMKAWMSTSSIVRTIVRGTKTCNSAWGFELDIEVEFCPGMMQAMEKCKTSSVR